ncbi:hypothetical protein [Croceibacterium ferulae]|uniref:hypothetical protein n=1 Tax=Croceibacterium ferulae TaxID=1854641 RepID=UPI000F878BB2|nr:hypothetical protein [Croceibacterium ferulae]
MDVVLILVIVALVVMALSAGLGLGLHLVAPGWSLRKRAVVAACIASGLPMSIAFGGFLTDAGSLLEDGGGDFALGLLALILTTVILAAVFCLPAAWWVSTRLAGEGTRPAVADQSEEPAALTTSN